MDDKGRYVCLVCKIFNISCVLTTFNRVLKFLLVGDLNMYLNSSVDKYSGVPAGGV